MANHFSDLPSVDAVLRDPGIALLPRAFALRATREVLAELRQAIHDKVSAPLPHVPELVGVRVRAWQRGQLRRVINATGIALHTNLGRAPWASAAIDAVKRVAEGYCNLEIDLHSGERGGRGDGAVQWLLELTGAEAAMVVNNCSAAVLLALTSLAQGREVLVSRGELVEIGGGFRVPEVITACGARLIEVGTTNRTRIRDFEAALGSDAAVLLRVHPSNFRVVGFTEAPSRPELVALARASGLYTVEDVGSGSFDGAYGEPSVCEAVGDGVDLVIFSGDKLLGGPQSGILVGRSEAVARLRRHPLYRALRVDKVVLAALEATLCLRAAGELSPVERMLHASDAELRLRADRLAEALRERGVPAEVRPTEAYAGGGTLPGLGRPSHGVFVRTHRTDSVVRALRTGDPAVLPRVEKGAMVFDVLALLDTEVAEVASRVASLLALR